VKYFLARQWKLRQESAIAALHGFNETHSLYNAPMSDKQPKTDILLEVQHTQLAPPPLYTVLLLNDDFTPMDFVVHILQKFFAMNRERATQIMLKVHTEGRGVCGVYSRDIAATKTEQVMAYARANGHPLACIMEKN